ncbi:hypothetical protein M427DRAFT_344853 [Gonapodya prolifera JEL478]|uniref:Uncharacterized protein n=1 Tax=Gonapodya prolifera (strain JEL478) TaxID=1344416 RepID=A0A139AWC6_GONPJ|nr:hypothetical protein M427DRAFT_344853 [Gonapodya prolifera JEL478]|eukprot:KXS20775.1 hypothetical protein M427DRAFT_344853 [Gonapodya prolifera JEL478]
MFNMSWTISQPRERRRWICRCIARPRTLDTRRNMGAAHFCTAQSWRGTLKTARAWGSVWSSLLTLSLLTESDGNRSAYQIYAMFFDRTLLDTPRPFDDAVFDGLNLEITIPESPEGYRAFVNTIRALFDHQDPPPLSGTVANVSGVAAVFNGTAWVAQTNTQNATVATNGSVASGGAPQSPTLSDKVLTGEVQGWTPPQQSWLTLYTPAGYYRRPTNFTLSATLPTCDFPSSFLGPSPGTLLTLMPSKFDYLVISYLRGSSCTWASGEDAFWKSVDGWAKWVADSSVGMAFVVQLPNVGWGYEKYTGANSNTFINVTSFYTSNFVPRLRLLPRFAAIALQDASFDQVTQPCFAPSSLVSSSYADLLYGELTAENPSSVGSGTPQDQMCAWKETMLAKGKPAGPIATGVAAAAGSTQTGQGGGVLPVSAIAGIIVGGVLVLGMVAGAGLVAYRTVYLRHSDDKSDVSSITSDRSARAGSLTVITKRSKRESAAESMGTEKTVFRMSVVDVDSPVSSETMAADVLAPSSGGDDATGILDSPPTARISKNNGLIPAVITSPPLPRQLKPSPAAHSSRGKNSQKPSRSAHSPLGKISTTRFPSGVPYASPADGTLSPEFAQKGSSSRPSSWGDRLPSWADSLSSNAERPSSWAGRGTSSWGDDTTPVTAETVVEVQAAQGKTDGAKGGKAKKGRKGKRASVEGVLEAEPAQDEIRITVVDVELGSALAAKVTAGSAPATLSIPSTHSATSPPDFAKRSSLAPVGVRSVDGGDTPVPLPLSRSGSIQDTLLRAMEERRKAQATGSGTLPRGA